MKFKPFSIITIIYLSIAGATLITKTIGSFSTCAIFAWCLLLINVSYFQDLVLDLSVSSDKSVLERKKKKSLAKISPREMFILSLVEDIYDIQSKNPHIVIIYCFFFFFFCSLTITRSISRQRSIKRSDLRYANLPHHLFKSSLKKGGFV